jgi:general secretion pathway protein F
VRRAAPGLAGRQDLLAPRQEALAVFFRSLSTLMRSAIPLERALHLLGQQADDPRMAAVCRGLAQAILSGASLSQGMSRYPRAFSVLHCRLVEIGERTGFLDSILERLSCYEEKRRATTMKVRSALTYPALLFLAATLMLIFLPPSSSGASSRWSRAPGYAPPCSPAW